MDKLASNASAKETPEELFRRFSVSSAEMNAILSPRGLSLAGDPTKVWSEIQKMPLEKQIELVERFIFFKDICAEAVGVEYDLVGDARLIWLALSKLKVKPPSELFSLISPNDYIEIYDATGIQVFRNFEFCKLTTYTLGEMLIHPWHELYGRDEKILGQILPAVQKLFGEKKIIEDLGVETHVCHETKSQSGRSFKVQMRYFAPLFGDNNTVPYLFAGSAIERIS